MSPIQLLVILIFAATLYGAAKVHKLAVVCWEDTRRSVIVRVTEQRAVEQYGANQYAGGVADEA